MKTLTDTMLGFTQATRSMQESDTQIADSLKAVADSVNTANKEINALRSNMNRGIDKIGGLIALQMLGQSMEHIGQIGEHLFTAAIEQGADFQQSMKNIQVVLALNSTAHENWNRKMQDSIKLTDQLQQLALELGSRGAQSANEVAAAIDTMLRSGVTAQAILGGAIKAAQDVAIVTGDTLDESAALVTEIFHQFREQFAANGKSIQENMRNVGDVIVGTLLSARISTTDFLNTLKYVGPLASQLGSGLDDAAAAAATLAMNGIQGSQAGTTLRRVFTNLLEPTKAGAAAMEKLGLIVKGHNQLIDQQTGKMLSLTQIQEKLTEATKGLTDAQKAQFAHDVFGQYALAGSLVLLNANSDASGQLKQKIDDINSSSAAASMLDTFNGHMKQLAAHVATTAKEFGLSFIPVLEKLIPIGNAVLNFFQSLPKPVKEISMGVLAVGSAFVIAGGALMAFGMYAHFAHEGITALKALFGLSREVSLLGAAFSLVTNPWVLLVTGIVAGVALIVTHWKQIVAFVQQHFGVSIPGVLHSMFSVFQTVFNGIKSVALAVWGLVGPYIIGAVQKVAAYWKSIWPELKDVFGEFWSLIKAIMTPIIAWWKAEFSLITSVIQAIWDPFWHMLASGLKSTWDWMTGMIRTAWDIISGIFKVILDLLSGRWRDAWNDMKSTLKNVWSDITRMFSNMLNDALSFGENFVKMIANGIMAGVHWVENAVSNVAHKIKSFLGFSSPTEEGPGAESDQWAPNFMKMYQEGIQQNIPKLQSTLTVALETPFRSITNQLTTGNVTGRIGQTSSYSGLGRTSGGRVIQFNGPITINAPQAKDARGIANAIKQQFAFALTP